MDHRQWPPVLRERLGDAAATALAEILQSGDETLLNSATERFDRRLGEECGKLRTELRGEMQELRVELHGEMRQLRSDFKVEGANIRADLLKWSFLFWVGQVAAVTGLVTLLR